MPRSYQYNGNSIITPVQFINQKVIYSDMSLSGRTLRTNPNIQQLWGISFDVINAGPNLGIDSHAELFVDIIEERTAPGSMPMIQFPAVDDWKDTSNDVLTTKVDTDAGVNMITVDMPSGSNMNILPKGAFFQFSNHDKIYLCKQTITRSSSTSFELSFYPNLITDVPASASIYTPYSDPRPTFHYWRDSNDISGLTFEDSKIVSLGTIKLIEAL